MERGRDGVVVGETTEDDIVGCSRYDEHFQAFKDVGWVGKHTSIKGVCA